MPRVGMLRAQASDENKDTSVDVHVNQGGTSVEKRPRRMAMDVSPFGMSVSLLSSLTVLMDVSITACSRIQHTSFAKICYRLN